MSSDGTAFPTESQFPPVRKGDNSYYSTRRREHHGGETTESGAHHGGKTRRGTAVLSSLMRCNENGDDLLPQQVSASLTGAALSGSVVLPSSPGSCPPARGPALQPGVLLSSPGSAQSRLWVLLKESAAHRAAATAPLPPVWLLPLLGGEGGPGQGI